MISQIFKWWCDGLASAFLVAEKNIWPPNRYRLSWQTRPYVVHAVADDEGRQPIRIPDHVPYPEEILQKTRGSTLEIPVPTSAILGRKLAPLPSESRQYLDSIIRHQLETILPWSLDNVIYTTRVDDRDDGRLDVSVWATSRNAIASALEVASACSANETVVVGADADMNAITIPARVGSVVQSRIEGIQRYAEYSIIGAVTLAALIVGWTGFVHWSLASEVVALDQAITDRRAILRRMVDPRGTNESDLDARKRQTAIAVVVVESLSATLPDDTFLTELSLDSGRIRITGISARPTELITRLESSNHFKNASFYAPTTRMLGGATDRFSIEATVVPQFQVTP